MIRIEPLGTDVILPAFVIGYELTLGSYSMIDRLAHHPIWLTVLDQQAGGMAMSYPSVIGVVLRLEKNLDRARSEEIKDMIQGFKYMAEDPKLGILEQRYPVLRKTVYTSGQDYSAEEIKALEDYISAYIRIPPLKSGLEAFLRHEDCNPLDFFNGWQVMTAQQNTDVETVPIYSMDTKAYYVDDSNLYTVRLLEEFFYNQSIQDELTEFVGSLGAHGTPQVYFLWENCD